MDFTNLAEGPLKCIQDCFMLLQSLVKPHEELYKAHYKNGWLWKQTQCFYTLQVLLPLPTSKQGVIFSHSSVKNHSIVM